MNTITLQRILFLLPVVLAIAGCREGFCEAHPEACLDDDGTGDGETGVPETGRTWCTVTPDAEWTTPNPDVAIEDPNNGNGDPEACFCANEGLNDDLEAIDASQAGTGAAVLQEHTATYGDDVINFRNALWGAAEDRCEELATANPSWANNCLTAIDKNEQGGNPKVTPLTPEGSLGDCSVGMDFGSNGYPMPADNWSDYYTLSSVIGQDPTSGIYEVDQTFFDDMLDNPAWILNDSARVDWNGSAYQLYDASAGTIAAALGLQTGDEPQTLNSIDITTIDGMLDAHQQLQTSTSFTLVVDRAVGPATLSYSVVP